MKISEIPPDYLPDYAWLGLVLDNWDRVESGLESRYDQNVGRFGAHTELWRVRQFRRRLRLIDKAARLHLPKDGAKKWLGWHDQIVELSERRNAIVHGRWVAVAPDRRVRLALPDDWEMASHIMRMSLELVARDDALLDKYVYGVDRLKELCVSLDGLVHELFLA